MCLLASVPWSTELPYPIDLPGRRQLVTLRDAGPYIAKLSKAEQSEPHWQAAAEVLCRLLDGPNDVVIHGCQELSFVAWRGFSSPFWKRFAADSNPWDGFWDCTTHRQGDGVACGARPLGGACISMVRASRS
jgi:hypothetical protein